MSPRARALALAAAVAAFVAGLFVGPRVFRRPVVAAASETPAVVAPAQCIPPGVRGVVLADVARLRASPTLAPYFAPNAGGESEPCEARLLRGVSRVAAAFPGEGLDDFAVAFAGDLPRERLLECARSRQGGGASVLTTARYHGVDVLRAQPRRENGLLPAAGAEIVYLPGGTVLAGEPSLVRRMVDRALGPPEVDIAPDALAELRTRLGPAHAVEALAVFPGGAQPDPDADRAFRHVVGIAVGASIEPGLDAVAVLACDDFDSPRAVADALERARTRLRDVLVAPPVVRALSSAVIERRAADVRVTLSLSASETDALANAARALLATLGRAPQ